MARPVRPFPRSEVLFELGFVAWFIVAISLGSLIGVVAGSWFEHYKLSHTRHSRSRH